MKTAKRILILFVLLAVCATMLVACDPTPKHKVTIVEKSTGVSSQSVKADNKEIASGDTVKEGTKLTVTWTAESGYAASLFVDGQKTTHTSPAEITVEADIKIEVKATQNTTPEPADEFTVTIVDTDENVTALMVKDGDTEIESGDKVEDGTTLTITWTIVSGFNGKLFIDDTETSHTSPAEITVDDDIKIEVKTTQIPVAQHTVTIVSAGENVSSLTVKKGNDTVATGSKVDQGTVLTVTWQSETAFDAVLYLNDQATTHTSPAQITVSADTKIEVKASAMYDTTVDIKAGAEEITGITEGHFTGTAEGADISENVSFTFEIERPTESAGKFTHAFKCKQLVGETGGEVQLLIFDSGTDYWDILNNWQYLDTAGTEFSQKLHALTGYTGYLGSVEGNTIGAYVEGTNNPTGTLTWDAEFRAENTGVYLVTMDVYVLYGTDLELKDSYSVLINVYDDVTSIAKGEIELSDEGNFTGSYVGTDNGAILEGLDNISFELELDRPTEANGIFTRVFKITQLTGTTGGDVKLLGYDDGGDYWDILNNWDALQEHKDLGENSEFLTAILAMNGYTGYWGAVNGNTINMGTGTASQTLDFVFVAENAGKYLVTMDVYMLNGTALELKDSHSVLVNVYEGTATVQNGLVDLGDQGTFTGSYAGTDAGVALEGLDTVSFELQLERPTEANGIFTRVFKVEQLTGKRGGKVQLLAYDDGGDYWDVLNNWDALQEHKDLGENSEFLTAILAMEGYTGYWGAVNGNTINMGTGTASQTLDFVFAAENAGTYLVTMDVYTLNGTALNAQHSHSVLVTVE